MSILNHSVILTDYYRFFPIGADKESLARLVSEIPRAYLVTGSTSIAFCQDSADILTANNANLYRFEVIEDLQFLFGAMVKDISDKGVVTKYKAVGYADNDSNSGYVAFDFFREKVITEEIKLNRFLKRFTTLNDREIDSIGTSFVESRDHESFLKNTDFVRSTNRAQFRAIYGAAPLRLTKSRGSYKSIYDSCMQGMPATMPTEFSGYEKTSRDSWQEIHPCEAYASGDFEIVALTYKDSGKPAARCILAKNGAQGPIYADSRIAGDALIHAAESTGLTLSARGDGDFIGMHLLGLVSARGLTATPYLDNAGAYGYDGDGFTLRRYGTDYGNTSGFTALDSDEYEDDDTCECAQCGHGGFDESDLTYIHDGDMICDSCRRYYFQSDESDDWFPDAESVSVYSDRGHWLTISADERDNGDYEYCENSDEWIHSDYMVTTECGTRLFIESSDCLEIGDSYYIQDSPLAIEAQRIQDIEDAISEEDKAERERIAALPYYARPIERDPDVLDLFDMAA